VLALHISNRYLELTPVVAATAQASGLTGGVQIHSPTAEQLRVSQEITPSRWVVLARRVDDLGALRLDPRWQSISGMPGPVWTDDYSNIAGTFRIRR
jgi:hypothetical protein